MLLQCGHKAAECVSSQDADDLITQLMNYKNDFGGQQDERLGTMERFAVDLWGTFNV